MIFTSIEFLIFLPIVFLLYWSLFSRNYRLQNGYLLISSYIFYGWWDWRFLFLIFCSTFVDYHASLMIFNKKNKALKKLILFFSIFFNLGILGFFKYFNFFIDSWISLLKRTGFDITDNFTYSIILPVGISFYTFQTMSYTIDTYHNKLKPTRDFVSFASFVSFFPQLVAGPIERANNLLPQILKLRSFKYLQGIEGLRLILWGLFKKVVIADNLANHVNIIFNDHTSYNGGVLFLILIYFSFQIYCDFSGYSDIAIGTAKLFGLELMSNFKFPYFAKDLSQFWKRWHISLSTWFRDYVYVPLGGSKRGKIKSIRNLFIVFLISGMWHGANWTFIVWGFIHAIFYIPIFLRKKYMITNKKKLEKSNSLFKNILRIGSTFIITTIAWTFFRSSNVYEAFSYLSYAIDNIAIPNSNRGGIIFIFILLLIEIGVHKNERDLFKYSWLKTKSWRRILRLLTYYIFAFFIFHFSKFEKPFIYFQF